MEIEKPKVKVDDKNLNEAQELLILTYEVFEKSEAGKKLLQKLKELYIINNKTFTTNTPKELTYFGSVEVYCGYKEGQKSVIFAIEEILEAYKRMDDKQ